MSDQKRIIEIKVSLDDGAAVASATAEAKAFSSAAKAADRLEKETSQLSKSHKSAASSMDLVASKAGGMAGKIVGAAAAYVSISAAIDGYSRALSYIGEVGGNFEQSMANTKAVLQPTEREFAALSQSAKNLGATTVFTASQAGDAYTELGKLGFDTAQILSAGNDVLVLAAASNLSMADAATAAATVVRQFGLTAGQTSEVVDIMAKSFSISALDASNFTEAMQYVGPAARAAGISVSEASAALGVLADNGIKGSMAGTGLRRIILELSDSTSKASRAVRDINPNAQTLVEKMQALKKAGLDTTSATELFRVEASTAAIILASGTDSLNKYGDALRYAEGGAKGFAKGVADTQLDTFQGDLKLAQSALEGAAIAFAEAFGPAARESVQLLTSKLGDLTKWAEENPDKLREWANTAKSLFSGVVTTVETLAGAVAKVNDLAGMVNPFADIESAVDPTLRFQSAVDKAAVAMREFNDAQSLYNTSKSNPGLVSTSELISQYKEMQSLHEKAIAAISERDRLMKEADADPFADPKKVAIAKEAAKANLSIADSQAKIATAEAERLKKSAAAKPVSTKGGEQIEAGGISTQEEIDKAAKKRDEAIKKADSQYAGLLRERELSELDSQRRALLELMYHWDEVISVDMAGGARHVDALQKMRDDAIAKMLRPTDVETVYEVRGRISGGMEPTGPAQQLNDGGQAAAQASAAAYEKIREERYNAAIKAQEDAVQSAKSEYQIEEESYQSKLELLREFNLNEEALTAQHNAKINELNSERYNAAVNAQEDAIQSAKSEYQIEEESYQSRLELLREFNLDEEALTAQHNAKINELNMLRLQQAGGLATSLGLLAQQVAGDNKAAMATYKILATAGAAMDTYASANKAFNAAGGWPWGLVPAAASVAYGLANVAAINNIHFAQGTKSPDASFGRVGGAKYSGDMIPAMLTSGETVLSRSESDRYFSGKGTGSITMNYSPTYNGDVSPLTKRQDMRAARRTMRAIQNDRAYGRSQAAIAW